MAQARRSWNLDGKLIMRRVDLRPGESESPVPPGGFVERWVRDAVRLRQVLEMLRHAVPGFALGAAKPGDRRVQQALLDAFRNRVLVFVVQVHESAPTDELAGSGAAQNAQAAAAAEKRRSEAAPESKSEKTWVEFRLLHKNGKPVSGARYRLKITDGSVRTGNLDSQGSVRVSGIDPGQCEISFLDYDGREWKRL